MAQVCYDVVTHYWPASGLVNGVVSSPSNGYNNGSDEDQSWQACYDCAITKMVVRLAVAPGINKKRRFTLRKNGADTSLRITFTGSQTEGTVEGSVSFGTPSNSLDKISIKEELMDSPSEGAFSVALVASSSIDRQVIVTGRRWGSEASIINTGAFGTQIFNNNAVRLECGSACGELDATASKSMYQSLFSSSGVLKNFRLLMDNIPCPSPSTNRVLARFENDTVSGIIFNYIMQITTGIYTDSNNWSSGYSWARAAGQFEGIGRNIWDFGAIDNSKGWWTVDFIPTIAGHRVFNCDMRPRTNSIPTYHSGVGAIKEGDGGKITSSPDLDNEPFCVIPTNGTIKNLYVDAFNSPASSKPLTITIRKNGSDTAVTLTITNPSTTGNNTSDEISVVAGDYISIKMETDDVSQWNGSRKPKVAWTFVADDATETPIILSSFGAEDTALASIELCEEAGIFIDVCPYVSGGQVRKMVDTLTGLDHFEGETVKAVMDGDIPRNSAGKEVDNAFEVSGGEIALPKKAAVAHVGLGYDGIIKFLKTSDGSPFGTGQTKNRRVFLAVLRLYKTLGLKVGYDENHLDPMFDSDDVTLFTGDKKKLPNSWWDEGIEMMIKQDKPLPAYILAAIWRSEVEERL